MIQLHRAAIVAFSVVCFFQIGLLQLWRALPVIGQAAPILVLLALAIVFAAWGWRLDLLAAPQVLEEARTPPPQKQKPIPTLVWLLPLILGLVLWGFTVLPHLDRTIDTWGDEDFHFLMTTQIGDYLSGYLGGDIPPGPARHSWRYPDLMYLLHCAFANPFFQNQGSPFWQRLPLVLPFLATVLTVALVAWRLLGQASLALLCAALVATSPTLLAYTADKYLDIAHPLLAVIASYGIYRSLDGVGGSLHQSLDKKPTAWWVTTAVAACLLTFVRDNTAPTTLAFGLAVSAIAYWQTRRIAAALLLLATATLPFFLFYFMKVRYTQIDANRLEVKNLFHQDYGVFFQMLPVYVPFPFLILSLVAAWASDDREVQIFALVSGSALWGQLAIYGLFETGWMPWSRNYLMFFGQFTVLALVGAHEAIRLRPRWSPVVAVLLGLGILANLGIDTLFLNRNKWFHEAEIRYDYERLFTESRDKGLIADHETVYMNFPTYARIAFDYAGARVGAPHAQFIEVKFKPGSNAFEIVDFMTFEELASRLPQDARLVLFHWRDSHSMVPALRDLKRVARPSQAELSGWTILADITDPWSRGADGMLLLKRTPVSGAE